MINQQHPITPPLALINQWWDEAKQNAKYDELIGPLVAIRAAQWGADQELEACCSIALTALCCGTKHQRRQLVYCIRAARRPRPPSLKEQALEALERQSIRSIPSLVSNNDCDTIRRALEQLDD
jgi:hypothetical protein